MIYPFVLFAQYNSWDGKGISPHSKFRALNLFISVIYDVNPILIDSVPNPPRWPMATQEGLNNPIPDYLLEFMDTVYNPNNWNGIITRK